MVKLWLCFLKDPSRKIRSRQCFTSDSRCGDSDGDSFDRVALQVQILLALDQLPIARQVYEQAKTWAEDSLVIQLCEAWIGLRTVSPAALITFHGIEEDLFF